MDVRLIKGISESQIIKIWQHQLLDRTGLVTEEGEAVKVIYPGRINGDQGADFRDAVIATSRGLLKGDIEIHVKSSGWLAHQHHLNPTYDRVILHVVMWHNTRAPANLQNGKTIPTLALYKYTKNQNNQHPDETYFPTTLSIPCSKLAMRLTTDVLADYLDSAGEERFLTKSSQFRADLAQTKSNQSLYQGIMGALGYSKNKLPCLELARRVPLQTLESITQYKISDEECLARQQAILLGSAGLLPSQHQGKHQKIKFSDKWEDKLERLWTTFPHTEPMPGKDWHLFKVRPNNYPIRRIIAISYLILNYKEKGVFEGLVNMVKEVPLHQGHNKLEKGLMVTTRGFWPSHLDSGVVSRVSNQTLLGRMRAADIVVNVLLPFTFAWSQLTSQPELQAKALDLYHCYPRIATNAVERHMTNQFGLHSSLVNSAQRQQGLIHIYNTLCTQGRCNSCHLGQLKTGINIQI